jgi:ubiquinone/menaquinone biosynthesis C-methylase UbiE
LKPRIDHFGFLAPYYERFIPPQPPEELLSLVKLPAGGVVLDAGGGTGRVAQFLHSKTVQVWVADESFDMLQEAQKKDGVLPVCSHTENTPFADHFFDRIIMVDALHHVANQRETAGELLRILKPGGRMVIEEPDIRWWGVKIIALVEKLALMRSHILSPEQIAGLFRSPGIQVQVKLNGSTVWVVVDKESRV